MEVQEGRVGRIFLLKFSDGEDLLEEIIGLARRENLRAAWILFLGAVKRGHLVVGPQKTELPPVPVWEDISQASEIVGLGNLFWEADNPRLHLHGALGRSESTRMGCLRQQTEVYLVAETLVLELVGISAYRRLDPALGVTLLHLE